MRSSLRFVNVHITKLLVIRPPQTCVLSYELTHFLSLLINFMLQTYVVHTVCKLLMLRAT